MSDRDTLRLLRSAAQVPLDDIASATGTTTRILRKRLAASTPRGGCAQAVAEAAPNARSTITRSALIAHRACPPYAARAAGGDRSPMVRAAASGAAGWSTRSQDSPAATRATLICHAAHRPAVAGHQACPTLLAAAICVSNDHAPHMSPARHQAAREVTAAHPLDRCEPYLLAVLATDEYWGVRERVASHPLTPMSTRTGMVSDPDWHPRAALAFSGDVADSVLLTLAQDPETKVRSSLVRRRGLPEHLLRKLGEDPDPAIRSEVAAHRSCPSDLLAVLAADPDQRVRCGVAGLHPRRGYAGCPPDLLDWLAADPDQSVRVAAAANPAVTLKQLRRLTSDPDSAVRATAASNESCPAELLAPLATDQPVAVRHDVAGNPNCDLATLRILATDRSPTVREHLAERRSCPAEIAEMLAADSHPRVRQAAALHTDLNPALFA